MEQERAIKRVSLILNEIWAPDAFLEPVESYSHSVWLTSEYAVHFHRNVACRGGRLGRCIVSTILRGPRPDGGRTP